jgi:thiamine-monophosphate kinase
VALKEFELIRQYFANDKLAFRAPGVVLGPGDDAAILAVPAGQQLVMSMDTLNESVHFLPDADPYLLGQRCLRVNLSDLAAMGADPLAFTLAISLPTASPAWLAAFSAGLAEVAAEARCPLIGGDTTRGPLSVTIQVHGTVPAGLAVLRSGANTGDRIYVTGTLGDAAAALWWQLSDARLALTGLNQTEQLQLTEAFYQPELRLAAGRALRGCASAALDLSDGLASDLGHILAASCCTGVPVGADIWLDTLPLSPLFRRLVPAEQQVQLALGGGDDYELCFCVADHRAAELEAALAALQVPCTQIGRITATGGIFLLEKSGRRIHLTSSGYQHFG